MSSLSKKIFKTVTHALFEEHEFKRLEKDLERRFRKADFEKYGVWRKIKYIKQNIQYLTLVYYRLSIACKVDIIRFVLMSLYRKYSAKTGIEFSTEKLGGGVIMPHWGRIILNAKNIGDNLYVFHNVTIGNDYTTGKPEIGDNVFIGTNSVILGNIKIGSNVVIGACSFVNTDIPSNSIAAGVPAKVIRTIDEGFISRMLGY
jgi:serine O-acetyltransferase